MSVALPCLASFVNDVLAPRHGVTKAHNPSVVPITADTITPEIIADLKSALGAIPADDYASWINNGQRLKTLGGLGCELWMDWSATSLKFDAKEAAEKWNSFAPDRTGYRAVFAEAQKLGWVNPRRPYWADMPVIDFSKVTCIGVPLSGPARAAPVPVEALNSGTVPVSHPHREWDSGTPTEPAARELKVDVLEDFASLKFPARQHLLAPIIPLRGLAMIYAPRGVGKTHVATGIAYAVASGGTYLRWKAPTPRKVLVVDGEMPAELLQQRIQKLIAGAPCLALPGYFRLIAMDRQVLGVSLNLAKREDQEIVEANLEGTEFLVLDNISTLVSGGRENDAESWDSMQAWLLHLRRLGVSVLLVAHAGRGENARGTSKREDVLDTVIWLRRPDDYVAEEGARFEVHITKGRGVFGEDAIAFEAKLEAQDGADMWTHKPLQDVVREKVMELTQANMSVREIAEELAISKSSVQRIQAKMRAEGVL